MLKGRARPGLRRNSFFPRYGIKTFPALVYFRNGNPLAFDGRSVLEPVAVEWSRLEKLEA